MQTTARTIAALATTSLAIGLLGALAPAGQASPASRLAVTARVPAAVRTVHLLAGRTRPVTHRSPATSPAIDTITGLVRALSRTPATGLALPPLTRWELSHLGPGSDRQGADQASSSAGSITGTVTGDGHRLGHICVIAEGVRTPADPLKMTVTTKTGRYQLRGLHAGQYDVTFLADGDARCPSNGNWLQQWYRGVNASVPNHKVVPVPVRPGRVTKGIDARLRHGAEITGTIRDKAGKPLSGICALTIGFSKSNISIAEGRSDRSGHYVLGGLFPGRFITSFMIGCGTKRDYAFQWWRNTKSIFKAAEIKIVARHVVSGIDPVMLPGAAVVGTVRAGSVRGKPVPRVCIGVGGLDELLPVQTVTGKKGAFKIEGLGTGHYTLRFDPTCHFQQISPYLQGSRPFKVTGGHIRHLGNVPLRIGARLTGVVRDSSGHRLAGVCVDIEDRGVNRATTGSSGTYSIVGIGPGKDFVSFSGCATAMSVVGQYYNDRPSAETANKITFRAGRTVSGVDATMQPAGTLTGLVTDRHGRPLAHVCVGVISAGASDIVGSGFEFSARTRSNGRYLVRNVTPGPYQVSIGCYGGHFAGRWFNNKQDSALGGFLSISAGLVTTLNGSVGQPGAITGMVTSQAGKPLNNICVFVADAKAKTYINGGGVEPEFGPPFTQHGQYQILGLTPGRYLVQFDSCERGKFADLWYKNGTTIANATPVTVRPGRTTTGVNQVLVEGGSISGTVTGPSGQPAKNICVQALDSASQGFQETTTNAAGRYALPGLGSGRATRSTSPPARSRGRISARRRPPGW